MAAAQYPGSLCRALVCVIYRSIHVSYWITLPLAVLAAAFLVRIFIIFHDCGHRSFYASRSANRIVGFITGMLTLTPFHHWRWQHALHHGTSGDLDQRGAGDIWMLTVQEYLDSSRWRRFAYRLARNPHRSLRHRSVLCLRDSSSLPVIGGARMRATLGSLDEPRGRRRDGVRHERLHGAQGVSGDPRRGVLRSRAPRGFGHSTYNINSKGLTGSAASSTCNCTAGQCFLRCCCESSCNGSRAISGFQHIHHLSPFIANYHLQQCHDADEFFAQVEANYAGSESRVPWRFVCGTSSTGSWSGSERWPAAWPGLGAEFILAVHGGTLPNRAPTLRAVYWACRYTIENST